MSTNPIKVGIHKVNPTQTVTTKFLYKGREITVTCSIDGRFNLKKGTLTDETIEGHIQNIAKTIFQEIDKADAEMVQKIELMAMTDPGATIENSPLGFDATIYYLPSSNKDPKRLDAFKKADVIDKLFKEIFIRYTPTPP